MAVISGYYGGADFANPDLAGDYIAQYGWNVPATNDPEGFWGQFAMYLPNSFLFNLQTMRMEWSEYGAMPASDIRDLLDAYLN